MELKMMEAMVEVEEALIHMLKQKVAVVVVEEYGLLGEEVVQMGNL